VSILGMTTTTMEFKIARFEVAPFIDQAKYIRVFLPNRIFCKNTSN
jgi:hypothetical protein